VITTLLSFKVAYHYSSAADVVVGSGDVANRMSLDLLQLVPVGVRIPDSSGVFNCWSDIRLVGY